MISFIRYYELTHRYRCMSLNSIPEQYNYQALVHAGCVSSDKYQVTRADNAYGNAYRLDGCSAMTHGRLLGEWEEWEGT